MMTNQDIEPHSSGARGRVPAAAFVGLRRCEELLRRVEHRVHAACFAVAVPAHVRVQSEAVNDDSGARVGTRVVVRASHLPDPGVVLKEWRLPVEDRDDFALVDRRSPGGDLTLDAVPGFGNLLPEIVGWFRAVTTVATTAPVASVMTDHNQYQRAEITPALQAAMTGLREALRLRGTTDRVRLEFGDAVVELGEGGGPVANSDRPFLVSVRLSPASLQEQLVALNRVGSPK